MKSITLFGVFICISVRFATGSDYDAETEVRKRTLHLEKMCEKFSDPRRIESESFVALEFGSNRFYRAFPSDLFVCVPLKTGTHSWRSLTLKMYNEYAASHTKEEVASLTQGGAAAKGELYNSGRKAIQVRHPLERLLSSYIFSFLDSSTHRDLTRKVRDNWINQFPNRAKDLKPVYGEDVLDQSDHPTLTFRQFVNFLTECTSDMHECMLYVSEGVASHWMPFWRWCGVCQKDNRFDYVIDMHHMEEDKNFMFAELGIETEVEAKQQNPTVKGNAASDETKKKYFGQLSQKEIYNLYERVKLDCDLFGYTPDEYLELAYDAEMSAAP